MASPDTGRVTDATAARAALVLAVGQWVAVGAVLVGFLVGWIVPDPLPGVGRRLHWGGTMTLTATPLLALLSVGLGGGRARRRLAGYAVGTLAVALLGAALAR